MRLLWNCQGKLSKSIAPCSSEFYLVVLIFIFCLWFFSFLKIKIGTCFSLHTEIAYRDGVTRRETQRVKYVCRFETLTICILKSWFSFLGSLLSRFRFLICPFLFSPSLLADTFDSMNRISFPVFLRICVWFHRIFHLTRFQFCFWFEFWSLRSCLDGLAYSIDIHCQFISPQ